MPPPRVVRVTNLDSPPGAGPDLRARMRRVQRMLHAVDDHPRRLARRWGPALFAISFLAVIYCTLFPFNFTVPRGMTVRQAAAEWDWRLYDPSNIQDWFNNIVMFLPFGFGLACLLRAKGVSPRWLALIATAAAALFSTAIETMQLWLPMRDSALADILANTTGSLIGSALFVMAGKRWLVQAGTWLKLLRRWLNPGVASIILAVLCGFALVGPYHLRHHGRELSGWNPRYALALGSEPGGTNKAWNGTVYTLDLASSTLSPGAVDSLYAGESFNDLLPPGTVQHSYVPYGVGEYNDRTGHGPPLKWVGVDAAAGPAGVHLSADHYLVSTSGLEAFNRAVARGSALTVRAVVQSAEPYQGEKRVIAAVCDDVFNTNVTLMQDSDNLLVHVRTLLSGNRPSWIIRDLFAEPGPHDIVITYQEPRLRVYVDSPRRAYSVDTPIDFFEIGRFVARFDHVPIDGFRLEIYRILYYLILFVPIGIVVGVMAADPRTPQPLRRAAAIAGILIPCLLMQGTLWLIDRRPLRADNLILNLVISSAAMLITAWWLSRSDIKPSGQFRSNVIEPRGR